METTALPSPNGTANRTCGKQKELFSVCKQLAKTDMDGILLISTMSDTVLSNKSIYTSPLQPCNHGEADTRIILHLAHASSQGQDKTLVCTVDSDIVVPGIAFFEQLGLSERWIGFDTGRTIEISAVHRNHSQLGPSKIVCSTPIS